MLVAFGKLFIGNPDLPRRLAERALLNQPEPKTFYSHGPEGYIDLPSLEAVADRQADSVCGGIDPTPKFWTRIYRLFSVKQDSQMPLSKKHCRKILKLRCSVYRR